MRLLFFFFSSRRRHTRCSRDWSSDVCSSDLIDGRPNRQELRTVRAAIDAFKLDWNRDGDLLLGPLCVNNKLTCKETSSVSGYPKSLQTLLEVKLTGEQATVKGATLKRYLRRIQVDPLTGKADWLLRCFTDPPDASSWCGDDVYDLASASPEVALDGTKYRDW